MPPDLSGSNGSGQNPGDVALPQPAGIDDALQALNAAVDSTLSTANYMLVLADQANGIFYSRANNNTAGGEPVSMDSLLLGGSSSKIVTAAMIMYFADQGLLNIDDPVYQHVDFWDSSGPKSAVTLKHLLSHSSGFIADNGQNPCLEKWLGMALYECAQAIHDAETNPKPPATAVRYVGNNYRVAGYMAKNAVGALSFHGLFEIFKSQTGLFKNTFYTHPDIEIPQYVLNSSPEGGLLYQVSELTEFLRQLAGGQLLSEQSFDLMRFNHSEGLDWDFLPGKRLGWRYGMGLYLECEQIIGPPKEQGEVGECDGPVGRRLSSPGGFGTYPFIDLEEGYVGLVAMQEMFEPGDRGDGGQGAAIVNSLRQQIKNLVRLQPD